MTTPIGTAQRIVLGRDSNTDVKSRGQVHEAEEKTNRIGRRTRMDERGMHGAGATDRQSGGGRPKRTADQRTDRKQGGERQGEGQGQAGREAQTASDWRDGATATAAGEHHSRASDAAACRGA